MYEDKTRDNIQTEMLTNVSDDYDKTVGSFIYDSLKPAAIQLENMYNSLNDVANKLDIENLIGDELDAYITQRIGITRNEATYSIGTLSVTGTGTITEGDIFETISGVRFVSTETKTITTSGTVSIRAAVPGSSGNVPANQITVMPISIGGITAVTNPSETTYGYDEETDDNFRTRYYEQVRTPATSGNKHHYKNWAKEVSGVGDARVIPLWNGVNTVKVVIIDADKEPAPQSLINTVQEYIDPNSNGNGEGTAPIGAYCTVVSASGVDIDISFTPVIDAGYTQDEVINHVTSKVAEYLKEIAFVGTYVSYARIGSIILDCDCVVDYTNLTVNLGTTNITIGDTEVAVIGSVTIV